MIAAQAVQSHPASHLRVPSAPGHNTDVSDGGRLPSDVAQGPEPIECIFEAGRRLVQAPHAAQHDCAVVRSDGETAWVTDRLGLLAGLLYVLERSFEVALSGRGHAQVVPSHRQALGVPQFLMGDEGTLTQGPRLRQLTAVAGQGSCGAQRGPSQWVQASLRGVENPQQPLLALSHLARGPPVPPQWRRDGQSVVMNLVLGDAHSIAARKLSSSVPNRRIQSA